MTCRPRYDVGIIACTRGKNPSGVTPLTLYKGTPFVVTMKHAQQRCGRILIMSAKYGLLDLRDPVSYYDAYIPTLSPEQRLVLRRRLQDQSVDLFYSGKILSYLPQAYWKMLSESLDQPLAASIARPYQGLPMMQLVKVLSNETKGYGIHPQRR